MYGIGYHRYFGNFLRNCLEILWIFWEFIKNFLGVFWELFGGIFGRNFFGGIFGRIFMEELLSRN